MTFSGHNIAAPVQNYKHTVKLLEKKESREEKEWKNKKFEIRIWEKCIFLHKLLTKIYSKHIHAKIWEIQNKSSSISI